MLTSPIELLLARDRHRDPRRGAAERPRVDAADSPVTRVTLRYASSADRERLRRLAELDSTVPPAAPTLVAEVDGRLRAALPLDGSRPIADPFHRGSELIELLHLRAAHLAQTR